MVSDVNCSCEMVWSVCCCCCWGTDKLDDGEGRASRLVIWSHPGNDVTGMLARSEKVAGICEKVCWFVHSFLWVKFLQSFFFYLQLLLFYFCLFVVAPLQGSALVECGRSTVNSCVWKHLALIHYWSYGHPSRTVWYGIVEFNVPLDTVYVISETGAVQSFTLLIRLQDSGLHAGVRK